jgi:hypothetical protein
VSVGKQIHGVSKGRIAFIFRVKAIRSFKTLATIYPAPQLNTQVNLNLQEDHCENSNLAFFRTGIIYITDHELSSYKENENLAYLSKCKMQNVKMQGGNDTKLNITFPGALRVEIKKFVAPLTDGRAGNWKLS